MNFFMKLFGTRASAAIAGATVRSKALAGQLLHASAGPSPVGWTVYRSEEFCFELAYPSSTSWSVIDQSRKVQNLPMLALKIDVNIWDRSTTLDVRAGQNAALAEEALLDFIFMEMGNSYKDFECREADRITLDGLLTLATVFDFVTADGRRRQCLSTVRVKGHSFWHFQARGSVETIKSVFQNTLVDALR